MPNKQYQKGRRKEYKVKKILESKGYTVLRTAGSHGFADLIAIRRNHEMNTVFIKFIQVKPDNFSQEETRKLQNQHGWVEGQAITHFNVY